MVVFPNAKINLGLWVVEQREDGYHNLESCFYPVPWKDILEWVESDQFKFDCSGIPIPGKAEDNLICKAYSILKDHYDLPNLHIHLHKQIPMGAGLGGGSSDAAFFLKAINEEYGLGITINKMEAMANVLGSDCPYFLHNRPMIAKGTGDLLEQIRPDLKEKWISLIYPGIHISTAEAYSSLVPKQREKSLISFLEMPMADWKTNVMNDFEGYVLQKYPSLLTIKEDLYRLGADYTSMTGSGSCFYAISQAPLDLGRFAGFDTFSAQF